MKDLTIVLILIIMLAVTACGVEKVSSVTTDNMNPIVSVDQGSSDTIVVLNDDYSDALSVQDQLALGTIQLDETDLAVDEAQAAELLLLWQALQSLSNSDKVAQAEIDAVVNQIQDTMTAEQIQAIVDMVLTSDSLTALQESGELGGFGGLGNQRNVNGEPSAAGDIPGDGIPGGAPPDIGPGGGGFPDGGPPGGAPAGLSEDDMATRQVAFASGDFQEQALTGMVIRLLAQKSGEGPGFPGGGNNPMSVVLTVISETTGLNVEEIQRQTADGVTLGELIEINDGDVEAVHAALVAALGEMPNASEQDLNQLATEWLSWPSASQQPEE